MINKIFIFFIFCISFLKAAPYHLIWQFHGCEDDWIREILSEVEYDEFDDGSYSYVCDNAILILRGPGEKDFIPYLEKFYEKGYKVGIILCSDEDLRTTTQFYNKANFILRNYWAEKYDGFSHVSFFPLGYVKGFWKSSNFESDFDVTGGPTSFERIYTWVFLGDIHKTTRKSMYKNLKKVAGTSFVHAYNGFLSSAAFSMSDYRKILQNAIFAPCPQGNVSLDCFRTCEALEAGCIPIVERREVDYYAHIFGDYPFPCVRTWNEAIPIIESFLKNPEQLEDYRKRCFNWWLNYKQQMKLRIKELVYLHLRSVGSEEQLADN
jgi:hypothetical protein